MTGVFYVPRGRNGHRIRVSTQLWGKIFLPPLLPGFELTTFRSRVLRSYQQAIPKRYTLFADAFFFVLKKIGSLLADNTGTEVCVVAGGHTHMTTLQGKIAALTIFCRNSTNYK